ncbi:lipoLPP family protein, putative [Babesia ovata]|uniref:LipoLPP family protein, putative n=1 Tax=Babesia ovata TaxID=189622 RepID=A0A2H6KBK6_9APIC|nr:lipoLPP family protein, putative [Babesia ovata]GBE60378.1 lipoLPP family protein, putative [Babesia ovata]
MLDEQDLETLCGGDQGLNRLLNRHCLYTSSPEGATADTVTSVRSPETGGPYASSGNLDSRNIGNKSQAYVDSYGAQSASHVSHRQDAGYAADSARQDAAPSLDDLLQRLDNLNTALGRQADSLQRDANGKLEKLTEVVRSSNTVGGPLDVNDLASSLHQCEDVVNSISHKHLKLQDLHTLDYLEKILTLNMNAVSLIHNWEETLRTIQGSLQSFERFREKGGVLTKMLMSDDAVDGFTYENATTLRDIFLRLHSTVEQCFVNDPNFGHMSGTLGNLRLKYSEVVSDICYDVCTRFFSPFETTYTPSPEASAEAFRRLVDLAADVFKPSYAETLLVQCFRRVMDGLLNTQFFTIWEENVSKLPNGDDLSLLPDDIGVIVSSCAATMNAFYDFLVKLVTDRMDLFKGFFAAMGARSICASPDAALNTCIRDVVQNGMLYFEVFDKTLARLPRAVFLTVATEVMRSAQPIADKLVEAFSALPFHEEITQMPILPKGMLVRYINALDDLSAENCWRSAPASDSVDDHISRLEQLVTYTTGLKCTSNGTLSHGDGLDIYQPLAWIYNRLLLWHLRECYKAVMSGCGNALTGYFMALSQQEMSRDMNTENESDCRRVLLALTSGSRSMADAMEKSLAPAATAGEQQSVLSKAITHWYVASGNVTSLDGVNASVRQCFSEPFPTEGGSFFHDESGAVSAAVTNIVRFIARKASNIMRNYANAAAEPESDTDVSSSVLLLSGYFTALLPLFADDDMLPNRILAQAFTVFVDEELERLAGARPSDPALLQRYRADISQLIVISNYCGSDVNESLEMLLSA